MKIEVRCSDCKCTWLVEQSAAAAGVNCPMCEVAVPPPAAAVSPEPARSEPAAAVAVSAAPAVAVAVVAAPPPPDSAAAATEEKIVCPRCKLHFNPFKRAPVVDDSRRPTVLVVEDLEYFREVAADSLGSAYVVKTAQTVHEARVAIAEGGIDLIVLDLTLDDNEGGRDLLIELDPKPCPILIFTAQDESEMYGESWEELKRMGADDLVIKGMNVGESLTRKVGEILGMPVDDA